MSAIDRRGWSNKELVRERDKGGVRRLWRLLLGMTISVGPAAGFLVNQNECLQIRYQVGRLEGRRDDLAEQERLLRLDVSRLESLADVEAWASRRRDLVKRGAATTVVVELAPTAPTDLVAGHPPVPAGTDAR